MTETVPPFDFMKDKKMSEEARQLMNLLQTQSAATPFDRIEIILREDLGDRRAEQLLDSLECAPVSIASIGQVHRGRLTDEEGTEVAVKVRHPDIEDAIRSDFKLAAAGTGLASVIVPGMGATAREFRKEIEARLLEECDYALEAKRQRLFESIYANHPVIVVPYVHEKWCHPGVPYQFRDTLYTIYTPTIINGIQHPPTPQNAKTPKKPQFPEELKPPEQLGKLSLYH